MNKRTIKLAPMTITVTNKQGQEIYKQLLDDSKTLNVTIAFLMQQQSGDDLTTVVSANGHDFNAKNVAFPIERLIRRVNGIVIRESKAKA